MPKTDNLEKLQISLKKKEAEALEAKDKGLHAAYGNIMLEINLLKTRIKKFQMGSR